jgi:GntR family transcriptional regulator
MGVTPPKYARVTAEIQRRIEAGEYAPGALLPSEYRLAEAFGVSRPTVVRALSSLRQDGWIETRQGRGSFARGRPVASGAARPRALELSETAMGGMLVQAGVKLAPAHVATSLGLEAGAKAFLRQRLLSEDDGTPAELASAWLPLETAAGTDLASPELLPESIRHHLASRKKLRLSHAAERISARRPTAEEAGLLGVAVDAPVLSVIVTAYDATARPVLVADIVLRGERCDAYPFA